MLCMGFHSQFIHLIMMCIAPISYKVLVNGFTTQPIKPTRGLRQGCPLSPYFLCAEALSLLLKQAEEQHHLRGISVCHNASRPSYVWRSIYEAKSMIKAGSLWRIGRGDKIKIWTDN
ncbi:hypothetical protein I3842_04G133200 [Carya illinoinensis]|uniref:Reverse transcriptase domain-containing protein n=1 Tax=Carya illinoinensis TaxID=32201 RepID=A0A922FDK8_CARIL|nr:hypothetical protein I3842_04G133200 [Carya illinoinensis]